MGAISAAHAAARQANPEAWDYQQVWEHLTEMGITDACSADAEPTLWWE
jgi:hypothetical protein